MEESVDDKLRTVIAQSFASALQQLFLFCNFLVKAKHWLVLDSILFLEILMRDLFSNVFHSLSKDFDEAIPKY